jgi:hypothetical protein
MNPAKLSDGMAQIPILKIASLRRTLSGHTNRILCGTGFDREFFGTASSSLDRPLTHAVTFTDLLAAFVKNIPLFVPRLFRTLSEAGTAQGARCVSPSADPRARLSACSFNSA